RARHARTPLARRGGAARRAARPEGRMRRRAFPPSVARALKGAAELTVVSAAFVVAYLLRFDFSPSPADWMRLTAALPFAILARVLGLWAFGLFGNWWWRYVGLPDLIRIANAATFSSFGTTAATLALVDGFPRSVFAIDWMLSTLVLAGVPAASRVLREWGVVNASRRAGRRVLVVGAGEAGIRLVGELRRNAQLALRPLGFVDDDPAKQGAWVQGLRVLGRREDLPRLVERLKVEEIVIAIP